MAEILVSTGALIGRPNGRDFRLLKPLAEKLHCDGFEFMMYDTWYDRVSEITAFLLDGGFRVPVVHCEKTIGENISKGDEASLKDALRRLEINADIARRLGTDKMVLHLWDGVTSDRYFENNKTHFGELRKIAADFGQDLLVENVVCAEKTPMDRWAELRELYPEIGFVFDTKMAEFHGQTALLYDAEYDWLWKEGHLRHFHVNDYTGGIMDWEHLKTLPVGRGQVDWARFFAFLSRMGYDGTMTLESTAFDQSGTVNTEMLNAQVARLRETYLPQAGMKPRIFMEEASCENCSAI